MRNKKAKESIRKFDKEKRMEKARNLQRNKEAPISKYYREQAGQAGSLLQAPSGGGLPAISGTQLGFNPGSMASSQQHLSVDGSAGRRGLSVSNHNSAKVRRMSSNRPPQAGPQPRLNMVPGRMRGNESQYRGFVGDLGADLSSFNVSGLAL